MRNRVLAAIAVLATLGFGETAVASDCETYFYNHNGSQMRAERCLGELKIWYESPRSGIANQGVGRGTLFFDGFISSDGSNEFIAGTARVFKRGCAPAEFPVEGMYGSGAGSSGGPIHLEGQAPVRKSGCTQSGWRREILDFN
ncbi:MAG: hypothetical protein WBO55_11005 [Rhizobiaceae bacterium]